MKLKDGVIIAPGNNEFILVDATGSFKGMIKLNESAAFIVRLFENENTIDQAVQSLCEEYNISESEAKTNIENLLNQLISVHLIEQ